MLKISSIVLFSFILLNISAQRNMEDLGRGLVAMRTDDNTVFLSWRLLGTEPENIVFNLYCDTNLVVSTTATNYVDTTSLNGNYSIRPVIDGDEKEASMKVGVQTRAYFGIPLQTIGDYYVHLVWVGDLDGDGEYDYVVDRIPNTGGVSPKLEAYRRDGTFLWRVDLGPNGENMDGIAPGSAAISNGHNDGVTVYDLDSDGRAEVILKTANGVVFGDGTTLEDSNDDAQYISVLNGITGAEEVRAPVPQDYISIGPVQSHFGIMYCDGVTPSFVFKAKNRRPDGSFNLMVITYDYKDGELTQRWKWNRGSTDAPDFHQIRIMDIDGDGRDELCDGGYVLDDDGSFLYKIPGVVHGDRFHITDFDPDRPGLEGYCIQQDNPSGLAWVYYDALDGSVIRQQILGSPSDLARGTAGDIDPRYKGLEFWTFTDGIYTAKTETPVSSNFPWPNFKIWWDGDVLTELLNGANISKWIYTSESENRLLSGGNYGGVASWRDAPQFNGDIFGDWREEVILENSDHSEIMIFTTTHPTESRLYTLPHNPGYRACMTVKGYMQSNLVDYYLGDSMSIPPAPDISLVADTTTGENDLPPFRPQNLYAIAIYDTINLSWSESNDTNVAGYNVYRSEVSNDNYMKLNDSLLSGNYYQDTSVVFETLYYYVVTAVDVDTNESDHSNEISITPTLYPNPPEMLVASDSEDSVKISWTKNKDSNIIGYNVYRSQTQGELYSKINSGLIQDSTYLDLDIQNGKIYYYVVASVNGLLLESSYSEEVSAMPGIKDIFEAENADFGDGCSHDSNHDGFFGTGFINFPSNGGYVEFTNVSGGEDGGDFTLRYRHALGNTNRTGMLKVNDASKDITMEGSGDWANWVLTDVAINLLPGSENVIRFQSTGQDFGNLDRIILLPYKTEEPENSVFNNESLEFQLQNYPNPFNSETVIKYNLTQSGFVSLRVFDFLGNTVLELVKQNQQAGHYEVVWNGQDGNGKFVRAGIYLYELVTEENRYVKKMIIVN